jgi:hypothetical protein
MTIMTERAFELPKGYVDENGTLHKKGIMRLATAADEILPLKDPRVKQDPAYLWIILLSRVVTKLGTLPNINTKVIEGLFAADISYLKEFYNRINSVEKNKLRAKCPYCGKEFEIEIIPLEDQ